jgi:NAD(P)-dependent dehydrogenase (short-subunit alcohol dehydrogenase family)
VIINTASVAAYEGQIGQAAYSASKGGVVGMTLPMAREFTRIGVRVMTIAPGVFHTPMVDIMPESGAAGAGRVDSVPETPGQAEEFAALAAHIVENAYFNGSTIRLDGAVRLEPK